MQDKIKTINYNDEKSLEKASLYFKSIVKDMKFDDEFKEGSIEIFRK